MSAQEFRDNSIINAQREGRLAGMREVREMVMQDFYKECSLLLGDSPECRELTLFVGRNIQRIDAMIAKEEGR